MNIPRFDLVFSYWIFVWFLLYHFRFVTTNPKWLLVFAFIENIGLLLTMIYNSYSFYDIITFIIINIFIKIIPLILLLDTTITKDDIKWYVIVIILFCIWLNMNGTNILSNIMNNIKNIKEGDFKGPIMKLL